MRFPRTLTYLALVSWGVLLAASAVLGESAVSPSAWTAATPAAPVFLQQAAGSVQTPQSPRGAGQQPLLLPTSVLPHTDSTCSVFTGTPARECSIEAASTGSNRCSAHCDSGKTCSAFANLAGEARCSTLGRGTSFCSVLQPPVPGQGGTACSALGFEDRAISCSVLEPATAKQNCSAENPGALTNFCSATGPPGNFTPECSALNGGSLQRNLCSTAFAGAKRCSVEFEAACSIRVGQKGLCTNLKGAPSGSCSVHTTGSGTCSVIGGASGTRCRQP